MATQPARTAKNLFAFLLGMLTLTQGLVLPTESHSIVELQKSRSVTNSRQPMLLRDIAESSVPRGILLQSLTRTFAPANSMSFKRAAVPIWTRQSLRFFPCFASCSLGCEVRFPSPTSHCGAVRAQLFRIRRSWHENGLSVRRSLLNPTTGPGTVPLANRCTR